MNNTINNKLNEIEKSLKKIASRRRLDDGENIYELSGGNYDDAYYIGVEDGEVNTADFLLEKYFDNA